MFYFLRPAVDSKYVDEIWKNIFDAHSQASQDC